MRDALLGRRPNDLDLATSDAASAAAFFAKATGGRRVTLGTRFQTDRVIVNGAVYDFSPIHGDSIESDLGRRDFTINAIGLELGGELINPFGGREDLDDGIVRMVSEENLIDDPLRIVRAPRMTGAFGFHLDPATAGACRRHRDSLSRIAPERVTCELRLILSSLHARCAAEPLQHLELDRIILGFALETNDVDAWERLARDSENPRSVVVTALLFTNRPRSLAAIFLERWTWRRDEVREITSILRVLDAAGRDDQSLLTIAADEGSATTFEAERILRARGLGKRSSQLAAVLAREPSPFDVEPLLDGHEIARITGAEGPEIGELKRNLWERQVLGEVESRDEAIAFVLKHHQR